MTSFQDLLFGSARERRFANWYIRFFSIEEIGQSKVLQWVAGATIFSYFIAFNSWISSRATTIDAVVSGDVQCWPYFQSCADWLFLRTLPDGYSQPFLYMVLFTTLVLAVYLLYRKEWMLLHLMLLPSFIWHALVSFVFTGGLSGNYDHYLFAFAFILLFLPHKEFFLKLVLVLFYFLAATIKISDGWVIGSYFSALETGLPLFPKWSIPIWTNLLIFMQIVGAWFLLSSHKTLQRIAVFYFTVFHLYSGLIVEYRYPATVLPTLLILFGPFYQYTQPKVDKRSIAGWLFVLFLGGLQLISFLIPGNVKLTMEGNKYGLYMFEANHQCVSEFNLIASDGSERVIRRESASARNRCDPFKYLQKARAICASAGKETRIEWTFDHSINGGPFLRIVDVPDACVLEYKAFTHNEWIKTEKDNPPVIGYPVENLYY